MSEINANIVISPIDLGVTVNTNQLTFTPDAVSLNIYTATGLPTTPTSLNANIANVHIYDGVNGYVLQTDGTGNLSWTAQTGNGGGNGTPGGANTQVQYNDSGSFGGNAGFTFNEITGNLNVPNNVIATNFIGNIAVANTVSNSYQPNITNVGTLTQLTVAGSSILGSNSNVIITGGNVNQALTTDGAGNLSWSSFATDNWANTTNISVGDLFFGMYIAGTTPVGPGNSISISGNLNTASWTVSNIAGSLGANGVGRIANTTNYIWGALGGTAQANIARSNEFGNVWIKVATPFTAPSYSPIQADNNIVIWKSGTNSAAYSSNDGTSWTTSNTARGTLNLGRGAYGNGVIIIAGSEVTNNNFIKSTDYGVTWSNVNTGANTSGQLALTYGNGIFMTVSSGPSTSKKTSDNGVTWSDSGAGTGRALAYGNSIWMLLVEPRTVNVSTNDGANWTSNTIPGSDNYYDITYASGYFVASAYDSGNVATSINGTSWTIANSTLGFGGSIAFNAKNNLLVNADRTAATTVASTITPKIAVLPSDGNLSLNESVPLGTYKNLGGAVGNVGAMWTRTA